VFLGVFPEILNLKNERRFLNCNGFADQKKHRFVSDIVREKDLHFVALSETLTILSKKLSWWERFFVAL